MFTWEENLRADKIGNNKVYCKLKAPDLIN